MLVTHHFPEESIPWMLEVRSIFGELIIFIDEKRVTPGTIARAERVGTRVHRYQADTWYEWDLASKARTCESDWVFLIECDEQLSPEWQQGDWRQLLETSHFTHFWCPRRWVVRAGRYVSGDPWWPDFQLRLFRNNLEGTSFPTKLHEPIHVPGAGACLHNLAIHHHVLWLYSRPVREARVRYYERLRPGGGLGHYYLYEDSLPPETALPKPVILDINREVPRMEKLSPEKISRISLEVSGVPRDVHVSALFWLDTQITNATDEALYPVGPHPVHLAYHWIEKTTRQMIVFDGYRSGLFPGLEANATRRYATMIVAPSSPGEYILQITMVQEEVCWFEDVCPEILQEFAVQVLV